MSKSKNDANTDLSTLPELMLERDKLMPVVEDNTATVRQARRFIALHSLILMFENAKIACRQIRKNGSKNIGNQVKQEMIEMQRKTRRQPERLFNPVVRIP
jgi:hypothetical protein